MTARRYYHREQEVAYRRLRQENKSQWSELFEETAGFDDFPNRRFLAHALARLAPPAGIDVLEYGCGTGPAACFLAGHGFHVEAIDLIPEAIELARRFARERGHTIDFAVQDICALAGRPPVKAYDLIVDSFCLQSIVTDADRAALFEAVRARLGDGGHYLVSTATYDPGRTYGRDERYDPASGICYQRLPDDAGPGEDPGPDEAEDERVDAVELDGAWYRPHRRHRTPAALRDDLARAGFRVLPQAGPVPGVGPGDLICVPDRASGRARDGRVSGERAPLADPGRDAPSSG